MGLFDNIPLDDLVINLRARADNAAGVEGAILGAGLGLLATVKVAKAGFRDVTPSSIVAGVLVGAAYGALNKRLIQIDEER